MAKTTNIKTPLMKQYFSIKNTHPDAILLFRVGDFYETFSEDAVKTADILGITLTKRANGTASFVELAGFPYHALDTYLPKLVRAGQRVAICEQLEDPKKTKKIVKRGVTELVTPGITLNNNTLNHKENNYLACVNIDPKNTGLALLDISTGEFYITEGNILYIDKILNGLKPKEILYERTKNEIVHESFGNHFYTYPIEDWTFNPETAYERLLKQFDTVSLKGFGVNNLKKGIVAAGAILKYLDLTHHEQTGHITKINRIEKDKYVWLDKFTIRNLELLNSNNNESKCLIDILDKTITPMGGRLMKKWISLPLKNIAPIKNRIDIVENLIKNEELREEISTQMNLIGDIERIVSRVALMRITPREIVQLKNSLKAIKPIKEICLRSKNQNLIKIATQLNSCDTITSRIEKEIEEDAPNQLHKGKVISEGVSAELDELRNIAFSGKDYLAQMQQRQAKITGISSLKISYNNVFGYYFEVRNTFKNRVPNSWIRKQTLVSAERYINEELKEYEAKILGAEEKIQKLENNLFNEIVKALNDYINIIQLNALNIAKLDCLHSFAQVAIEKNYCAPELNDGLKIDIKAGRHPVIEEQLPLSEQYISNDLYLDNEEQQIIIITGPNMAGKSALLRQTALIVLMAQIGSFVPAKSAKIGIVDKIFTRVGASDNISAGESTFMVEMNEAAGILNNISNRSLILFDELGRGTSTYDGISIAWSIVEYIHNHPKAKAKTLFATHYHELNEMEKMFAGIKNYNVSVKEIDNKIIFLRKLIKGGSEHSFGLHVAKMAGMPKEVLKRSDQMLKELEKTHRKTKKNNKKNNTENEYQLSFFQLDDPVLSQIKNEISGIDINNLTPLEALNKLNEIKKMVGG